MLFVPKVQDDDFVKAKVDQNRDLIHAIKLLNGLFMVTMVLTILCFPRLRPRFERNVYKFFAAWLRFAWVILCSWVIYTYSLRSTTFIVLLVTEMYLVPSFLVVWLALAIEREPGAVEVTWLGWDTRIWTVQGSLLSVRSLMWIAVWMGWIVIGNAAVTLGRFGIVFWIYEIWEWLGFGLFIEGRHV